MHRLYALNRKARLAAHSELCSGCRLCEIVCLYHHKRSFGRRGSSVHVERSERKGAFRIVISQEDNEYTACDFCKSESYPLCVRFCSMGAITVEER